MCIAHSGSRVPLMGVGARERERERERERARESERERETDNILRVNGFIRKYPMSAERVSFICANL
jgi:hypothetical protein